MKPNFVWLPWLGVVLLGALPAGAQPAAEPAEPRKSAEARFAELFPDEVVARGKDFEIKRSQLDEAFANLRASAAVRGQVIPETQREVLAARVLHELILARLLSARATEADKAKAKQNAEQYLDNLKRQQVSEELFRTRLRLNKLTYEEFARRVEAEALPAVVLDREVKAGIVISDDQVRKYYDDHPARFEEPERVRVSQILLTTRDPETNRELPEETRALKRKLIDQILLRARNGEDFAKLAREFSEDPATRDRGGEIPPFARGRMVMEFEAVAFSLPPNQISDVITTLFGYHIIKVHERIPSRIVPFDEAAPRIREFLLAQEAQKRLPEYFEKLKAEAGVEILDPKLQYPITELLPKPAAP